MIPISESVQKLVRIIAMHAAHKLRVFVENSGLLIIPLKYYLTCSLARFVFSPVKFLPECMQYERITTKRQVALVNHSTTRSVT